MELDVPSEVVVARSTTAAETLFTSRTLAVPAEPDQASPIRAADPCGFCYFPHMTSPRLEWMDALRGAAVLLVVLLHVPVIPSLLGRSPPEWLERWQFALQPYRMPMLLFLSGMLLERSLAKGTKKYLSGKFRGIVWPFIVWSVVTAIALREPSVLTSPVTWLMGYHHMWFLTILAGCYVLGLLARYLPPWVLPVVLAVVALLGGMYLTNLPGGELMSRFAWWGSFFFLGATSPFWLETWQRRSPWVASLFGLVSVAWSIYVVINPDLRWSRNLPALVLSAGGVLALVWLAPRMAWPQWLQKVGRNSIVWYLAHYPAIGALWILFDRMGVTTWWLVIPALALVGFGVPVLLIPLAKSPLFRWSPKVHPVLTGRNL